MYAIKDSSYRAINDVNDLLDGEAASETVPPPVYELWLTPSQQIILADGEDVAVVTINGEPGATVEFTVNGSAQSIALNPNGSETIELTSDTPGTVIVAQAGTARAVVYAVEVPS